MLSGRHHGIRRKPVSPVSPASPPTSPDPRIVSKFGQTQEIPLNDGGSQELPSQNGQSQESGRRSGIHWRASTAMVASLLFGMLLALGHHLFYAHLNGKPVGAPEHVLTGVTRQQLNLTLGTLFAFLVRAFLAVAVTIAYTQVVWRAVKNRATTLTTIDTMFHVVSNFWSLGHFAVWWRYPLLLLLALTIWCIPIASVVTPAALTVGLADLSPVPWNLTRVPRVDFLSLNFANLPAVVPEGFTYGGARYAVNKVVAATAAQGSILSLTPPAQNSSWSLDFTGPSITCTEVQGSDLEAIQQNIQSAIKIEDCLKTFGYIGWTPSYVVEEIGSNGTLVTLPFILSENGTSYNFNGGTVGPLPTYVFTSSMPTTFYTATYYNMTNEDGAETCIDDPEGNPTPNITVTQCQLYNSSYHASFLFLDGKQAINVTMDETPLNVIWPIYELNTTYPWGPLATYYGNGTVIAYDTPYVQAISYQAVMDAFGQVVVGQIWNSADTIGDVVSTNTSVMSTILGETEELAWLNDYPPRQGNQSFTLPQIAAGPGEANGKMWNGLDVVDNFQSALPLRNAMEQLFQNITIGLMGSRLLQPNYSSPYAPPLTNVSYPGSQTVYIYSASRLWIAYGLAILFSVFGVLIGLLAMLSNGVAYTNHFSTILRTARHANIETTIRPQDADGKDPLPEYLARASVLFSDAGMRLGKEGRGMSWFKETKGSAVSSRLLDEGAVR